MAPSLCYIRLDKPPTKTPQISVTFVYNVAVRQNDGVRGVSASENAMPVTHLSLLKTKFDGYASLKMLFVNSEVVMV